MPAIGGSIESITLAGRIFAVASDSDSNRKLGGVENEMPANGNRTSRLIKTAVSWSIDGVSVEIDDSLGGHEYLHELASRLDFFTVLITYASGISYSGRGQLSGEYAASSQNATAPITLMGSGILNRQ